MTQFWKKDPAFPPPTSSPRLSAAFGCPSLSSVRDVSSPIRPQLGLGGKQRKGEGGNMKRCWALLLSVLVLGSRTDAYQWWNASQVSPAVDGLGFSSPPLLVGLTLIRSAAAKGAVCLDGTLPGYHLHRGYGSGANSWLVHLEGGGWCKNIKMCTFLKTTHHGSSNHMERQTPFTGILSNKAEENPGFYNWNRVKIRYCDGASFSGEGCDEIHGLFFRGQRIWLAAMEELLSKGMRYANQALLTGCSAGGLSTIIHCDEFGALFPSSTKVKCLADAGLFLDVVDIAGRRALRSMFQAVVNLQGVAKNLPRSCTSKMNPTLCFFPQNIINHIRTPIFLLNSAYDLWQIMDGVAPISADPQDHWRLCKRNHAGCNAAQIAVLQGIRNQMLNAVKLFSTSGKNGLFINSCFTHCQSEYQPAWFSNGSPLLHRKRIALSVGDWFFDRSAFKVIDCPYPCDKSCRHQN